MNPMEEHSRSFLSLIRHFRANVLFKDTFPFEGRGCILLLPPRCAPDSSLVVYGIFFQDAKSYYFIIHMLSIPCISQGENRNQIFTKPTKTNCKASSLINTTLMIIRYPFLDFDYSLTSNYLMDPNVTVIIRLGLYHSPCSPKNRLL